MADYDGYHFEELSRIFQRFGITEDYLSSMFDNLGEDAKKLVGIVSDRLARK